MWSVFLSSLFAYHVVLDPGHGGIDTGAYYYGLKESKITLNIASDLKELLKKNPEIKVSMTRYKDQKLSLKERADRAHAKEAQIFISIHTNSSPDRRAHGAEIYFENQLGADEESLFLAYREENQEFNKNLVGRPSKFRGKYPNTVATILDDLAKSKYQASSYQLAQTIQNRWLEEKKMRVRLRQAPFFVISSINMPSVLVEVGFLSHEREAKALKTRKYQKKIAQILYKSILDWKEQWTNNRSSL
tara:strand:- start:1197 stop:1934 length:738 start_codon:yes stop_codon:yes gene_type:complete